MQDEVTQADREAAADFMEHKCLPGDLTPTNIRLGNLDDGFAVQAFARHRHQAERDTLAGIEPVAYMWTDPTHQRPPELHWHYDMGPPYEGWTETPLYALPPAPEAEIERLRSALREISDLTGEINPSNYDHDDACELNRQFCYAITVADAALNPPAPEAGQ